MTTTKDAHIFYMICRFTFLTSLVLDFSHALALNAIDRETFLKQSVITSSSLSLGFKEEEKQQQKQQGPQQLLDVDIAADQQLINLFKSKTIPWTEKDDRERLLSWSNLRYSSSSLQNNDNGRRQQNPITLETLQAFPRWMEGYWSVSMKFKGASFPQGRDKLTLKVPGAGLGTCLSIPNVGYNPAPFAYHFLDGGYEDVAYNTPRRFEAFWPKAKVISIQTRGKDDNLTNPCLVTGQGCLDPNLHCKSNTRALVQYEGPTRRGVSASQSIDISLVDLSTSSETSINEYYTTTRNYVQFNIQQDLQTFFRECIYLTRRTDTGKVEGRLRVGAFLPAFENNLGSVEFDDSTCVALYDYMISMKSISKEEATVI